MMIANAVITLIAATIEIRAAVVVAAVTETRAVVVAAPADDVCTDARSVAFVSTKLI